MILHVPSVEPVQIWGVWLECTRSTDRILMTFGQALPCLHTWHDLLELRRGTKYSLHTHQAVTKITDGDYAIALLLFAHEGLPILGTDEIRRTVSFDHRFLVLMRLMATPIKLNTADGGFPTYDLLRWQA